MPSEAKSSPPHRTIVVGLVWNRRGEPLFCRMSPYRGVFGSVGGSWRRHRRRRSLEGVRVLRTIGDADEVGFALTFVTTQDALDRLAPLVASRAPGDAVVWFAYPKKSSKRYRCEIDRDQGWSVLGELGFEGVRQVAIDEDWSALRFRRVEFIKSMRRDPKRAMTADGKTRAKRGS